MAVDLVDNNNSNYYTATDVAALTFPTGEFALLFWVKLEDNSGTAFQYLFSNNGYGAVSSCNVLFQEDSVGDADDGTVSVLFLDDASAGPGQMFSTTHDFVSGGNEYLLVFQRTATQYELWSCIRGSGNAVLEATGALGTPTTSNGGTWNLGRRSDGDLNRYYEEHFGEVAFLSGSSLTEANIEEMGAGEQTILELGYSPEAYWSLNTATDTADDSGNGHTLTKVGSPVDSGFQFIIAVTAEAGELDYILDIDADIDVATTIV